MNVRELDDLYVHPSKPTRNRMNPTTTLLAQENVSEPELT